LTIAVTRVARVDRDVQQVSRIKSEIEMLHTLHTSHEKTADNQQRQRTTDLRHNEGIANARLMHSEEFVLTAVEEESSSRPPTPRERRATLQRQFHQPASQRPRK
jgi:hypothetical protein